MKEEIVKIDENISKSDLLYILSHVMYFTSKLNKQDNVAKNLKEKGSYPFVPLHTIELLRLLTQCKELLKEVENPTFMDYGSGLGLSLGFAKLLGFKVNGVEIDNTVSYHGFHGDRVFYQDLELKSTFTSRLNKYDLVYYYCPFSNRDKEVIFELNAAKTVKVGGYIIAPNPGLLPNHIENKAYSYGEDPRLLDTAKKFIYLNSSIIQRIK